MTRQDYVKRIENITNKAVENKLVNMKIEKHYKELIDECGDMDLFNLTFLWLTSNYNEKLDFIEEFKREYNSLKGEFAREKAVINKLTVKEYANNQLRTEEKEELE